MRLLFFFLPLVAGIAITTQAGVNSRLRIAVGSPTIAALISFVVGTLALAALVGATRQPLPSIANLASARGADYLGGLLGALFVTIIIISANRIGASNLFALVVAGQLTTALLYDHFGLLGFRQSHVTPTRMIGVLLLIAGAYFVNRK